MALGTRMELCGNLYGFQIGLKILKTLSSLPLTSYHNVQNLSVLFSVVPALLAIVGFNGT